MDSFRYFFLALILFINFADQDSHLQFFSNQKIQEFFSVAIGAQTDLTKILAE